MNTTELIVSIVVGIGCCALGMFLGSMPLKREQITEEQNKYQQLGGLLACGLVVILMLLSMAACGTMEQPGADGENDPAVTEPKNA